VRTQFLRQNRNLRGLMAAHQPAANNDTDQDPEYIRNELARRASSSGITPQVITGLGRGKTNDLLNRRSGVRIPLGAPPTPAKPRVEPGKLPAHQDRQGGRRAPRAHVRGRCTE